MGMLLSLFHSGNTYVHTCGYFGRREFKPHANFPPWLLMLKIPHTCCLEQNSFPSTTATTVTTAVIMESHSGDRNANFFQINGMNISSQISI